MREFRVEYRSEEEIQGLAHGVLRSWGALRTIPVDIEHFIEKYDGMICLPSTRIAKICDSGGAISRDLTTIYVDWDDYHAPSQVFRIRMTVAHEYAHAKLHGSILRSVRSDEDAMELLAFFSENEIIYRRFEHQAFILGGFILVPEETLRSYVERIIQAMREEAERDLDLSSEAVWKLVSDRVARAHEVSPQVARRRLQFAGFWLNPRGG